MDTNLAFLMLMRAFYHRLYERADEDGEKDRAEDCFEWFEKFDVEVRAELREIGYEDKAEISNELDDLADEANDKFRDLLFAIYRNSPLAGKDPSFPVTNLDIDWHGTNVKPIK